MAVACIKRSQGNVADSAEPTTRFIAGKSSRIIGLIEHLIQQLSERLGSSARR